jgi:hypothetical protein
MIARELPWGAFVDDPLQITMRVRGLDLTDTTFDYLIQETPFTDPIVSVSETETPGADGVRLVAVGTDDSVPYSDVEIIVTLATLASAIDGVRRGQGKLVLYHKFQWSLPSGTGFSVLERTIFYGPLTIQGGSNG